MFMISIIPRLNQFQSW